MNYLRFLIVLLVFLTACSTPAVNKPSQEINVEQIETEPELEAAETQDEALIVVDLSSTAELEIPKEILNLLNENIGFVYHNLMTNQRMSYQATRKFYAASTVKSIIAMNLIDLGVDLSMDVVRKASLVQPGRGTITNEGVNGQVYSLEKVMREMMVSSDNTATQMAFEVGRSQQAWTLSTNYSPSNGYRRLFNGENLVTPEYMADAMVHMFNHQDHYQFVLDLKLQTPDQMNLFDNRDDYAKKPGQSVSRQSYSQIGIVFDKSPFVFVIYGQGSGALDMMQKVSSAIASFHE